VHEYTLQKLENIKTKGKIKIKNQSKAKKNLGCANAEPERATEISNTEGAHTKAEYKA
jgi:hypothetical protein